MRKILLFFSLACISMNAIAAFLSFVPQKIKQPNGEIISCFASGDEYFSWMHDKDGYTIILNEKTKYYVYAISENKILVPSEIVVGQGDPKALGISKWLMPDKSVLLKQIKTNKEKNSVQNTGVLSSGIINNIVIFITFSDDTEFSDNTFVYDGMFNNSANSLQNYFLETSYSKLTINSTFYPTPSGATVVSYHDTHPRDYYKKYSVVNPSGYQPSEKTEREHTLLKNAVDAVKSNIPGGLNVDENGDGYVDNVCFIIKGIPEAWSDLLWPHKWDLYTLNDSINGKRVYTYNFQLSDYLLSGPQGVGVIAHEIFHTLGAPDLYHYSMDGKMPVGDWDIMQNPRNPPQHMCAYMKYEYGKWLDSIPEIKTSGNYYLKPLTSSDTNCYKIKSPNNANEYYVIEYRKKTGVYENSVPASGLLVYRVNKIYEGLGNMGGPPDELYLYRPDGTAFVEGTVDSAEFSKNTGRVSINDGTVPSGFLSDNSEGGINISDIGETGNTISFKVNLNIDTSGLVLKSPNGGQKYNIGSQQNIKWIASHTLNYVNLKYSWDRGQTWIKIADSIQAITNTYLWTLPLTPLNQCKVKIERTDNNTVIDTSDYYFDIINPNSGLFVDYTGVIMPTKKFAVAVGGMGTILCTHDAGATWVSKCNSGDIEGFGAVCFNDSLNGFAVGGCANRGQINRTFDGGENWVSQVSPANGALQSVKMLDNISAVAVGLYGKIVKTTDGGLNWAEQNSGTTTHLWGFSWLTATKGIAVGSDGLILKTTDGGANWHMVISNTTKWLRCVSFCTANYGIIVGNDGIMLKTTNGGDDWAKLDSVTPNTLSGVFMLDLNNITVVGMNNAMPSTGYSSTILHSTNGGTTWQLQDPKTVYFQLNTHFYDSNNGYSVGIRGSIVHTTNGGITWQRQYGKQEIVFTAPQKNEIINANSNYDIKFIADTFWVDNLRIYFSTDDGTTWNDIVSWTEARKMKYSWTVPSVSSTHCRIKITHLIYDMNTYSYLPNDSLSWISDNFVIYGTPNKPILSLPDNSAESQPIALDLKWKKTDNAQKYYIQISDDINFNNIVAEDTCVTDTFKSISGLSFLHTYYWHVKAKNDKGLSVWSDVWSFTTVLSVKIITAQGTPGEYGLQQNQPNPFSKESIVKYEIPVESYVKFTVYNILGLKVAELINAKIKPGKYELKLNSETEKLLPGIYFYFFEAKSIDSTAGFLSQKRFIVVSGK